MKYPGRAEPRARRLTASAVFASTLVLAVAGCSNGLSVDGDRLTPGETDAGPEVQEPDAAAVPTNTEPPTVAITAPADGATVPNAAVRIKGTANDDSGLASVFVSVGPNVPVLAETSDGFRTWQADVVVPVGTFAVEARAYDSGGLRTLDPARILLTRASSSSDANPPTVTVTSPADGSTPLQLTALVIGEAQDDRAVVRMEVTRNGELLTERPVETADFFSSWARLVPLLPGETNTLVFSAYDELGNVGSATITLEGRPDQDTVAPDIAITSHSDGEHVDTDTLAVTGTAFDAAGIREVKLRIGRDVAGTFTWGDYSYAETSDGFAHWQGSLALAPGALTLEARAIDVNGLATAVTAELVNDFIPEWSDEHVYPLLLREGQPSSTVRMELDRTGVNEVIPESLQRDTLLLELDPVPLLTSSVTEIKTACGTAWQQDNPNPQHNCNLTPLGRTFHGSDGTWQTSPEYSLVRILTMTPANVVVAGTSIAKLQDLADSLGLGGGFNEILADTLGIARTREIVTTGSVVESLRTRWLESHPQTVSGGRIPITLYDAMQDMVTLGPLLGPDGSHPGLLDPSVATHSVVFGSNFRMVLVAESNLRWLDGVDLSKGKEYMATVVDTTGPNYDDVLEFDFYDPERFDVLGLIDEPTVDLRLLVWENTGFVPACTGGGCQANRPGTPYGGSSIWGTPAYQLEHIITGAAFVDYEYRRFNNCYLAVFGCHAEVSVGQGGEPAGWLTFDVVFDLGSPPDSQYLWELIMEVAEVALHNVPSGSIAEGNANVGFTLSDLPVGITAEEIREGVRPHLQSQASELSDGLLGDYAGNNGAVDFYYRRGLNGVPYLFFVAATDPRPIDTYTYTSPGFFSDPSLAPGTKLSATSMPGAGDTDHEKLALATGTTTVYLQDDTQTVYRLRIEVPAGSPDEITLRVARKMEQ